MAKRKKPVDENGIPYEQEFAGYEIYEKLQQNNFYTSWAARDLRLDRDVILKEMSPDLDRDEDVIEEFFTETSSVARVRHSNILRGLDTGRSGDKFYFVMEKLTSDSLASLFISSGKFRERKVFAVAYGVVKALAFLYEEGLCHGNINPDNILLCRDGTVKLADLGFPVRVLFTSEKEKSRAMPSYAAPELFEEGSFSDTSSDIYSLGTILYQMLAGRLPFSEDSEQLSIQKKLQEEAPSIRSLTTSVSDIAAELLMGMLKRDPVERLSNPHELLEKIALHPDIADLVEKDNSEVDSLLGENKIMQELEESFFSEANEEASTPEEEVESA